jgi:hypothetical protein
MAIAWMRAAAVTDACLTSNTGAGIFLLFSRKDTETK